VTTLGCGLITRPPSVIESEAPQIPFAAVSQHGPQGDDVIADNAVHTELEKILHLHGVVHRPDMDR